ncbi:MAG TPA: EscU/YscU/HrcU family type III secretion system export apparatus switch protein [Bryobacteraceae bacterium]|nr:EscU/YscU/HrcU family type III secretion system export apparatus switch protein [Bryobacteraceae bacterium]
MPDKSQKTEQPTPKRLEKARKEGQFPSARHFVSAVQLLASVGVITAWGKTWVASMQVNLREMIGAAFRKDLAGPDAVGLSADLIERSFRPLLLAGGGVVLITLALQLASTRLGVSLKKLAPDAGRLNPLTKLRQLPRQNLPAMLQAVLLLPVFGAALWFLVRDNLAAYLTLPLESAAAGAHRVSGSLEQLLWKATLALLVFGCVDLIRQRRIYAQDLRMSKQEIRDELKEVEGNPQMKAHIRRLRRDVLRRRMMQQVPRATAVVVNPTHFAVALRYEISSMAAPVVVAKGKNYLALRIRAKAIEHQVPLVENPPLAQALYRSAEVGQEIPAHLYRAVAEILAYIFRLMPGRMPAGTGRA